MTNAIRPNIKGHREFFESLTASQIGIAVTASTVRTAGTCRYMGRKEMPQAAPAYADAITKVLKANLMNIIVQLLSLITMSSRP